MILLLLTTIITLSPLFSHAQKGTIRGTIFDEGTGEPLFGVSVLVEGLQIGAVTDFDGDFEILVDPGTYSLKLSFN